MTLDEKLGQMSQAAHPAKIDDRFKDEIRHGRWGSLFNGGTLEEKAELQRIARKESRLGIPILFGQDVIHGYKTVFPIPLGQAASWDPELVGLAAARGGPRGLCPWRALDLLADDGYRA